MRKTSFRYPSVRAASRRSDNQARASSYRRSSTAMNPVQLHRCATSRRLPKRPRCSIAARERCAASAYWVDASERVVSTTATAPVVMRSLSELRRLVQEEAGLLAMTAPGLGIRQMGKAGCDPSRVVAGPEELERRLGVRDLALSLTD